MLTIAEAQKRTEAFLTEQMLDALDAATLTVRLERWRLGAEHTGWKFGWRDAGPGNSGRGRYVETYCYAFTGGNFLENELQQLYWRTDIVQMTRYCMMRRHAAESVAAPRRLSGVGLAGVRIHGTDRCHRPCLAATVAAGIDAVTPLRG
ncbi:MAG TPA: hypothetical protein VMF05_01135 [Stellaceae bacterium]|nr:hypothetical protein [Stellaceae bacterium]